MSDEYGANSGYKGSLVNESAGGNYPAEGDSTASGGYGSPSNVNVWSDAVQRGKEAKDQPYYSKTEHVQGFDAGGRGTDEGLVQQSLNGGKLSDDVKAQERSASMNPYAGDSFETAREANEMLTTTAKQSTRK